MTEDQVVLVNENDEEVGLAGKMEAHEKGLLHRAFSVVLFQKENPAFVLMQQRAAAKYHCPLMWANTCCSHPFKGETPHDGARRRVLEELGIEAPRLTSAGSFVYRASVGELIEHECDHVFAGILENRDIPFNPNEVATVEWVPAAKLLENENDSFRKYVPWLRQVVYKALQAGLSPVHKKILEEYRVAA